MDQAGIARSYYPGVARTTIASPHGDTLAHIQTTDRAASRGGPEPQEPSGPGAQADGPLSAELLGKMDAYWRASNYLSIGQIYLQDNPLLEEPLRREHIKPLYPPATGAPPRASISSTCT